MCVCVCLCLCLCVCVCVDKCLFPCGVKRGWNPGRGGHLVCQASLELLMELGGVIWKRVEAVDRYVSCICIYV